MCSYENVPYLKFYSLFCFNKQHNHQEISLLQVPKCLDPFTKEQCFEIKVCSLAL